MVRHGLRTQARQQHGFNISFDRQERIDQRNFVDFVRFVDRFGLFRQRQQRRLYKKHDAEISRLNPGSRPSSRSPDGPTSHPHYADA